MSSTSITNRMNRKNLSKKLFRERKYRRPQKITPFHIMKGGSSSSKEISDDNRDVLWLQLDSENGTGNVDFNKVKQLLLDDQEVDASVKLIMEKLELSGKCKTMDDFDEEPCSKIVELGEKAGYDAPDSQKPVNVWNEFIRLINELESSESSSSSSSSSSEQTEISDENRDALWQQIGGVEGGTINLTQIKEFLIAEEDRDVDVEFIMKQIGAYEQCTSLDNFDTEPCSKLNDIAEQAGYDTDNSEHTVDVWNEFIRLINELESSDSSSSSPSSTGSSSSSNSEPTPSQKKYLEMRKDYVYLQELLASAHADKKSKADADNDDSLQQDADKIETLLTTVNDNMPDESVEGKTDLDLDDFTMGGNVLIKEMRSLLDFHEIKYNLPSTASKDTDFEHVSKLLQTCEELKENYKNKHEEVRLLGNVITAMKNEFDKLMDRKIMDKDGVLKNKIDLIQKELDSLKEKLNNPELSQQVDEITSMLVDLPEQQAEVLGNVKENVNKLVELGTMDGSQINNKDTLVDLSGQLDKAITILNQKSTVKGMEEPMPESKKTHKKKQKRKNSKKSRGVRVAGLKNGKTAGKYIKLSRKKGTRKKK